METATKLIVCHARPDDAYEIQTDETPRRLVAALFHDGNDPARLLMEEAAVYASVFAAAPALLSHLKLAVELRQIDEEGGHVNWPKWFAEARELVSKLS